MRRDSTPGGRNSKDLRVERTRGELGGPTGGWDSWIKSRGQAQSVVTRTGLVTPARKEGERPGMRERRGGRHGILYGACIRLLRLP